MTRAVRVSRCLLHEPAQAPVALHLALELAVGLVRRLEVAHRREQRLDRARDTARRLAAQQRDQLPLVHEIDIAPQRRARPRVVRDAQPLVLGGTVLMLHLAVGLPATR